MVLRHLDLSIKWKGEKLGILEMRRHYSNYFRDLPKIKHYRSQLVEINDYDSVVSKIQEIKKYYT